MPTPKQTPQIMRELVKGSNTLTQGEMGRPNSENVRSSWEPDNMLIQFDLKEFFGQENSPMQETPTLQLLKTTVQRSK